jgi:hypothetical protein
MSDDVYIALAHVIANYLSYHRWHGASLKTLVPIFTFWFYQLNHSAS